MFLFFGCFYALDELTFLWIWILSPPPFHISDPNLSTLFGRLTGGLAAASLSKPLPNGFAIDR